MPGLSKVIVLDPDARARRQVQLGFEREGVPTAAAASVAELQVPEDDAGLVVVGGLDDHGVELVRRARGWLDGRGSDAPLVFAGRGSEPRDATAAGADEVVRHPAYLRDVVTIGRLLRGRPADQRGRIVGNLIELTGVFTLVRALSALGRSATLTLIRGLRRGEVRFYFGEVTSAQVGLIHGQAALHQLFLWTDARFDFHHEDVVRRQQIPLSRDELFADAERFLEGVRESSGGLSPAMVLEQDLPRVQSLAKQIPTEVYGVLRMFDGHRALADVLEDSAYRVFETLRVAQRAVEAGLIRVIDRPPPRPGWRTVLAIEDWLVGGEPRDAAGEAASEPVDPPASRAVDIAVNDPRPATIRDARGAPVLPSRASAQGASRGAGQGAGQGAGKTSRKRRKKKRRADTSPAVVTSAAGPPEIDWGALVPRIVGAEVGPLAGVVPASHVSGEIVTTARKPSTDDGDSDGDAPPPEPTIVFDEAAERAEIERAAAEHAVADAAQAAAAGAEAERAEAERSAEAHARAEAERTAAAAQAAAAARTESERAEAEAEQAAAVALARAAAEAARAAAEARTAADAERAEAARAEAERVAIERAAAEAEQAAAMALARAEAERIAAERAAARDRARAEAERVAAERAAAEARAAAQRAALEAAAEPAPDKASPTAEHAPAEAAHATEPERAEARTDAATGPEHAEDQAHAAAEPERAEAAAVAEPEPAEAEPAEPERAEAQIDAAAEPERAEAQIDAAAETERAEAEPAVAAAESPPAEAATDVERTESEALAAAEARASAIRAVAATVSVSSEPAHVVHDLDLADTRPERPGAVGKLATAAGAPQAAAAMASDAVVAHSANAVASDAITARMSVVSPPDAAAVAPAAAPDAERADDSTPTAVVDEPSDGVVRHHIATAETAPVKRRHLPHDPRDDDRPGETTGEITMPRPQPQIVIRYSEPTILVPDLAAIQAEVSESTPASLVEAAVHPAAGGAGHGAAAAGGGRGAATAGPGHGGPVFSDVEEAFFEDGQARTASHHDAESFDDLDEGYRPVGFWERLTGRGKPGKPEKSDRPGKKPKPAK